MGMVERYYYVLGVPPPSFFETYTRAKLFYRKVHLGTSTAGKRQESWVWGDSSRPPLVGSIHSYLAIAFPKETDEIRALQDVLVAMLRYCPEDRIKPAAALSMPFFSARFTFDGTLMLPSPPSSPSPSPSSSLSLSPSSAGNFQKRSRKPSLSSIDHSFLPLLPEPWLVFSRDGLLTTTTAAAAAAAAAKTPAPLISSVLTLPTSFPPITLPFVMHESPPLPSLSPLLSPSSPAIPPLQFAKEFERRATEDALGALAAMSSDVHAAAHALSVALSAPPPHPPSRLSEMSTTTHSLFPFSMVAPPAATRC